MEPTATEPSQAPSFTSDRVEARFLSRCYSTLFFNAATVFATGAWYVGWYHEYYAQEPRFQQLVWVVGSVLFLILVLSAAMMRDEEVVSFFGFDLRIAVRGMALPPVTFLMIAVIALMASGTEGWKSPFSQYLVAVSATAIALARSDKVKGMILALGIVCFIAVTFLSLSPSLNPLPNLRSFNLSIVIVAMIIAALAAWRIPPRNGQE